MTTPSSQDFLVELGTEELPPTSLKTLALAFQQGIETQLVEKKLSFSSIDWFATPRRLAVRVNDLLSETPRENIQVFGPPSNIAFDDQGNPTKAAQAFAKKNNVTLEKLGTAIDGKTEKICLHIETGGEAVENLLGAMINQSLNNLPIKKRMRWGASRAEFVRPVKWCVALLDNTVINPNKLGNILGMQASNISYGHRFHANKAITITSAKEYENILANEGHVIADFVKRQEAITEQVNAAASHLSSATAVISHDLLEEVTGLVEWPVALAGGFDTDFLSIPAEALISSMKEHQKYFHVVNANNKLLPYFITVSNINSLQPEQVIDGNERVIRPRLSDAAFFFNTDKNTRLDERLTQLDAVVFQAKLGTVLDKTKRIEKLAAFIASMLSNVSSNTQLDAVKRGAQLCKSDLVSLMVNEFSNMQGIAGYHYALNDGETPKVASIIAEHYQPKFAGDTLPNSIEASIVALADRIDTITGIFGIGQTPTGSKDPFALRRASLGALRIMVEKEMDIDLAEIIQFSASLFIDLPKAQSVKKDVLGYMLERFKSWYEDANIASEVFQAVSAKDLTHPLDINNRVYAVSSFIKLDEAQSLAAANKRVSNILAKQDEKPASNINAALFENDAEKQLAMQISDMQTTIEPLLNNKHYTQALTLLAALRKNVDAFFDDVMVMTDNENVRNNRLALLQQLRDLFLGVADISLLAVK